MSLATRCPACHTVFRVVQDQLRVSEGWVRCGQCQEVFNALETLFDLGEATVEEATAGPADEPVAVVDDETLNAAEVIAEGPLPEDHWDPTPPPPPSPRPPPADAPAIHLRPWEETPPPATAPPPDAQPMQGDAVPAEPGHPLPVNEPRLTAPLPPPSTKPSPVAEATKAAAAVADDETDSEPTPSRFIGPVPDWARQPARGRRGKNSQKAKARPAADEAPHVQARSSARAHRRRRKPEFVRQAERAAMWRRPAVRAVLVSTAGVLGLLLVLQVAYEYRDPLSAHVPALAPALHAGCAQLGCRITAPRAIERLRLDASDLTRTEMDQVLRFTADLHNSADFAVRAPALEVSFTDAVGRVVSRKVFQPSDLGLRGDAIEADAQWRIDARLAVGELQVAGYTVEVFYP
ncbi:zinc-ribbon and DUF3426 domain-containing protein [Ideonella sp. YS5]|uniref:zinc-ribbon and DUF3426 domain-containing protein n=1 Tax=Ideonella sp. YS5 TaxID=3453714 RepID=UPI003EED92FA